MKHLLHIPSNTVIRFYDEAHRTDDRPWSFETLYNYRIATNKITGSLDEFFHVFIVRMNPSFVPSEYLETKEDISHYCLIDGPE